MKRTVHLLFSILMLFAGRAVAQQALNPADPIVVYNSTSPPTAPAYGRIGKWVKTNRVSWNTSDFKCYIYKGLNFRLKFPKTYQHNVADGKKYPIFVFLHGRGEGGTVYDNEYQLAHGGQSFETKTDNGSYDGFLFYGQTADGNWGNGQFDIIKELLDSLAVQTKGDLNRVTVNGLSAGGYGSWLFMQRYPQYFAGALPMSGITTNDGTAAMIERTKYTAVWYFQGGLDNAPAPYTANTATAAMQAAGANLKYTYYPNLGHGTWTTAWAEADFIPYINRVNILTPWPLGGRSEFCPGETFSIRIGIPPGFSAYEWQKDGVTIPGATTNNVLINSFGTYAVRVRRSAAGAWSEWSPTPLVVKAKAGTVTPPIAIDDLATNVLPAPDGSTSVTLKLPTGYASYEWRTVGGTTSIGNTNTQSVGVGQYIARVTEQFGCTSTFSAPYRVIAAAGANVPDAVGGMTITSDSQTELTLNWTDKANPQNNETSFEIYRTTTTGTGYKLIAKTAADVQSYTDDGLAANTKYYYVIRPVNANGAGPVSAEFSGTTQTDALSPTAPPNLVVTNTSNSSVSLSWGTATDNVAVSAYDIYVNNQKAYTVESTQRTMIAYGLAERKVYNFYVVARDAAGNASPPSNQVTAGTVSRGLAYKYYESAGAYSSLPNFTNLLPLETGRSSNINLTVRNRETHYAIQWTGFLTIPATGTYYFSTNSDDGSKLWVNIPYSFSGAATVNNDGAHSLAQVTSQPMALTAGVYPITVAYFNATGGQTMNLRWRSTAIGVNNLTAIPDQYLGDTMTITGAIPAVPQVFGATATAFNKVDLNWTDNSNNETGFELYRSQTYNGTYSVIGRANANTTTLTDNTVAPNTRYYYKIRSVGLSGESAQATGLPYLAVYPFDNSTADISINNNGGTGNALSYTSTDKVENSHAAVFNGTSTYMSMGGNGSGFLHDAFAARTLSMWIKPVVTDNNRIIFDMGGSDNGLALRINANKLEAGVADNSTRTLITTPFTSTAWTHVAVVYNGGTLNLYINGDLAASTNTGYGTINATSNNSRIGANNGTNAFNSTGTFYRGNIDRFTIIGAAMTQAQISQLASQTLPFYSVVTPTLPAPPSAPVNLVATSTSPSTIRLNWTNNAANATGYDIQRSFGTSNTFVLLKTIETVAGTSETYTDTALYANQQYVYRVRTRGDGGNSAYTANASATTGNNRPSIDAIGNQSARYDVEARIPITASDVDEDAVTLSTDNLPPFVTLASDANGSFLRVTPNAGVQGTYNNLTVYATDPFGGRDTARFNLTINDNFSPVITSIANISLNEGADQQLSLSAADQNAADQLTWSAVSLPSFISLTGNNRTASLTINPGYADAGVYTVKVATVDGNGGTDNKTFTVTIADVDPNYKLFVSFKHQTDVPAPWNNISTVSTANLKNDKGETTTVGLQLQTSNWFSWNEGPGTGNNSGVYPDAVMREYYFFGSYPGIFTSSNSIDVKLTGLSASRKYSFKFLAGSSWSVLANNGTTIFTINGVSKPINVQGNTTTTVNFDNIAPDANGEITFNMAVADGTQVGYLNAFEVNAILDDGTVPAAPKELTATEDNGSVSLAWTNIAYNATGYRIHRATDSLGTYSLLGSLNSATAAAYVDNTVHGNTHYYYKVSASNSAGVSTGYSNIAGIQVAEKAPTINNIADVKLKAGTSAQFNVTATGDLGNTVTLTVNGLPSFGDFTDNGNGTGSFSFAPSANNLGSYNVTLTATDNQGAASSNTFKVIVSDKNTTSVFIDFSSSSPAPAPWNNVAGFPYQGVRLTNALDESGNPTGINVTFNEVWENDQPAVGMSTYDNSGVYPDVVMQSAVYDSRNITHTVRLSGLNNTKRYNVVFFSSLNFGVNAKVRYTINGDSVVIDPAYNTSLTKQINGIQPNANGEINILVNKTQAGYYMHMNAMVLESYDATIPVLNPLNLRAEATGARTIALKWSDRSNNETGYQVWRAVSGGSYAQVATLPANTVSYTDNNLAVSQNYYYKVRAVRNTDNSDYSNAASATTLGFSVQVNFSELLIAPAPWNNLGKRPESGVAKSNMQDGQNNQTGIGITILENFDGMYSAGINTGNNSGIYPDNVMVENYGLFPGNHADFNITGLNQSLKYDLVFFGSSVEWEDITGKYTVNGTKMALLNASLNKSGVVTIRDVSPDALGKIHIDVDPGTPGSRYGLIAALTIRGHLDAATLDEDGPIDPADAQGARIIPNTVTAMAAPVVSVVDKADFGDAKVYPNPFDQQFNVDIVLKAETAVRVEIFDVTGRLLYSDYKGSVPAGASTLRINTGSKVSAPGIYLLRISGKNGETKMVKLVKR